MFLLMIIKDMEQVRENPSEKNAYQDIESAYHYLTEKLDISADKIIAYGRSVGGGSAVNLAVNHPLAGLILESSFTSAFRVVIPFPILPFDKFPNLQKITKINIPILIIHGTDDQVIPLKHGKKLFEAANDPKLFYGLKVQVIMI
jgi:abhydrolase domain-containing protein 17